MKELEEMTDQYMLRREDNCHRADLPPKTEQWAFIPLRPDEDEQYRKVLAQPFSDAPAAAFKRMHELRGILAGGASSKLERLRDMILGMEEEDEAVVVSGRIDGSTTTSSRMANIDAFNTEANWKLFLLAKASRRIWRPGQRRACTFLSISQNTIEEKILLRACSKQGCWPLCPAIASRQELRRVFEYPVPTLWSALDGEAQGTAWINGVAWKAMQLPIGLVMTKCAGLAQDSQQQPSAANMLSASTPSCSAKKPAKKRVRVASQEFVKKNKYMYTSGVYSSTCVAEEAFDEMDESFVGGAKKRGQLSAEATVIRDAQGEEDTQKYDYFETILHVRSQNLTCDGEVHLNGATVEGLVEEIGHIVNDSLRSAALQSAATERLAEQNRQIAARNKGMPKGSPAAAAAPLYRGYTQAQYGTSGTAPAGIDCRAALLVASFVEARRAGLEEFLHRCLRIPQLSKECPIFLRFLESAGEGDGISLEELRRSFDGRSIAEMCGTFQTAFADQLARLESPPDDSKLSDAKSFLEAHVVKLRDLTVALRDACDAQKHATALASTAQARFASVSSSDTADAARKPRSIIAAALKQQDEVFQEAPGFHYDLLLAAAERELDETEAMQEALLGLGALHQRLVDAQQKRVFVEVEQKRLSSRTDSGEPSALGKLFGKRDKTTKLEDLASQHAQSLEDAKYAEEWYASARVIAISRELD
ncbi:DNAJB6, partial [Symbiodinium necroappetens]